MKNEHERAAAVELLERTAAEVAGTPITLRTAEQYEELVGLALRAGRLEEAEVYRRRALALRSLD